MRRLFPISSYELPLVYLVMAILLIALGPGKWSIDALLFAERAVEIKG